jgi:hypothetical protein
MGRKTLSLHDVGKDYEGAETLLITNEDKKWFLSANLSNGAKGKLIVVVEEYKMPDYLMRLFILSTEYILDWTIKR